MKILLPILCCLLFSNLYAQKVALLIGNSKYVNQPKLGAGPGVDADAILKALKTADPSWNTTCLKDASLDEMEKAIKVFAVKAESAKSVFFYFAGHGVQIDSKVYMMPVNAPNDPDDFERKSISHVWLSKKLKANDKAIKLFVLDCCRDNPLAGGQKFKGLTSPFNQKFIFSAPPLKKAPNNKFSNGPFAIEMVDLMKQLSTITVRSFVDKLQLKYPSATEAGQASGIYNQKLASHNLMGDLLDVSKIEGSVGPRDEGSIWFKTIDAAIGNADQTIIFFDAVSCPHCRVLDKKVLSKPGFREATTGFSLVRLNYSLNGKVLSEHAETARKKYGVKSYPTMIIVDRKGNLVKKLKIPRTEQKFIDYLAAETLKPGASGFILSAGNTCKVWSNFHDLTDKVTWTGKVSEDNFASGKGTLTWYSKGKYNLGLEGMMVKGRLEGAVIEIDVKGSKKKTFWVKGKRSK